ncbi:MAG: hypothetical protein LBS93_01715, partial [Synergistaceae bacterium]|nr:hypothetical protein [Synergistaceae bacterium]
MKQKEDIERLIEEYKAEGERILAEGSEFAAFANEVKKQFIAAGRNDLFGKTGAKADALIQLHIARAIRKAQDLGITSAELAKPGAVTVVREGGNISIRIQRGEQAKTIALDGGGGGYGQFAGMEGAVHPGSVVKESFFSASDMAESG